MKTKTNVNAGPNDNQTGMRASALRRLNHLCAGLAIAAGLFGQAAFAQPGAVFRGAPLNCSTSTGFASFAAASWSLAVDPVTQDPKTVTITKPFDACSAALYKMANPGPKGSRMKTASITVRDAKNTLLVTIEMDNVGIGNYVMNGGANTETFTLTFTGASVVWP